MKKLSLMIPLFFVSCFISYSQRIWQSENMTAVGVENRILIDCGDTIINGEAWIILKERIIRRNQQGEGHLWLRGFIREKESVIDFLYPGNGNQWQLYDFGMAVGDTIVTGVYAPIYGDTLVVESVDSISFNGTIRKKLTLRNILYGFYDIWIEGIGSTENYFFSPGEHDEYYIEDGGSILLCFKEDEELISFNQTNISYCKLDSINVSCDIMSSTKDRGLKMGTELLVYPNPFQNSLMLEFDKSINQVEIFDSLGNLVFVSNILNESAMLLLNTNTYLPGVYMVKIRNKYGKETYSRILKGN